MIQGIEKLGELKSKRESIDIFNLLSISAQTLDLIHKMIEKGIVNERGSIYQTF